jgi:hypothetical protein
LTAFLLGFMRAAELLCFALLLLPFQAVEARTRSKKAPPPPKASATQYKSCEALCADLNASIQKHPERLVMWLEDALVIRESCVADIITAAMDAVGNDPTKVRFILDTAIHVAPARKSQILLAAQQFRVPAAARMAEQVEEVRRAVLPEAANPPPSPATVVEVRRALLVEAAEPTPIVEIRRAVVPVTASVVEAQEKKAR